MVVLVSATSVELGGSAMGIPAVVLIPIQLIPTAQKTLFGVVLLNVRLARVQLLVLQLVVHVPLVDTLEMEMMVEMVKASYTEDAQHAARVLPEKSRRYLVVRLALLLVAVEEATQLHQATRSPTLLRLATPALTALRATTLV